MQQQAQGLQGLGQPEGAWPPQPTGGCRHCGSMHGTYRLHLFSVEKGFCQLHSSCKWGLALPCFSTLQGWLSTGMAGKRELTHGTHQAHVLLLPASAMRHAGLLRSLHTAASLSPLSQASFHPSCLAWTPTKLYVELMA